MNTIISAKGVHKRYGKQVVLNTLSFDIKAGRIIGLIGANGSGKTTLLKTILGLTPFDGELSVLGLDPRTHRDALMNEICFITDVAILPRWLKVCDAIDFVEGIHPKFNRTKAKRYLANTKISPKMKVKAMSKGMIVQFHLALVMAIDAQLLVLDEPTLGLDVIYRKMFYQYLMEDYYDEHKTIIITTHQVDEIEHMLTDVMMIKDGNLVLQSDMETMADRFTEVTVNSDQLEEVRQLKPIDQYKVLGKNIMLFDGVSKEKLSCLGEIKTPSASDVFVAMVKGTY